jgi:WD40 repeat protein
VWDLVAHSYLAELSLTSPCEGLGFSPDGDRVVISAQSAEVGLMVWGVPEAIELRRFPGIGASRSEGRTFAVAPDFSVAVQAVSPGELRLVDLASGQERWRIKHQSMPRVAFSGDGKMLAVSDGWNEPVIRLLDAGTGGELARLTGHRAWISAVVLWPDGKRLASSSADQTIQVWDLADIAKPKLEGTLRGHYDEVYTLALLPDGRTLVSGGRDGSICFWDGMEFRRRGVPIALPGKFQAWQFTPDSDAIITCDWLGHVERWAGHDFQQGQMLLDFGVSGADLPADDRRWQRPGFSQDFLAQRMTLRFSADARWFATALPDGIVQVWDLERGALKGQFGDRVDPALPWGFLSRGSRLVTYHATRALLQEWDLANGKRLRSWPALPELVAGGFSPDERWCLMIGGDGKSLLLDLSTGKRLAMDPQLDGMVDAAISPDASVFAVASNRGLVRLWETRNLREVATLIGFTVVAHSVWFSPDGTRLAAGGSKWSEILLFDVRSQRKLIRLTALGSVARSVAFSPDGALLGTRDSNGNLQVWRAPSWAEINAVEKSSETPP